MPFKDKYKNREYQKNWAKENREQRKQYYRELRVKAITKLGGKCVNCGCDDFNALEINHINGHGRIDREKSMRAFYLAILNGSRKTDDLEITCRVCNALHYLIQFKGLSNNWQVIYKKLPMV